MDEESPTHFAVDNNSVTTADDTIMSRAFYWLRSFYIPTSPNLLLETQKNMFQKFVRRPVEHKKFILSSGDYLNYVDIRASNSSTNPSRNHPGSIPEQHKPNKPTLILMHGYGSGLGMFFGKKHVIFLFVQ